MQDVRVEAIHASLTSGPAPRGPGQAHVERMVAAARGGESATLVLLGGPTTGRSALVRFALEQARAGGMPAIEARGSMAESGLRYAALYDLARPLMGRLSEIPAPQAAALRRAFGLAHSGQRSRFLVCSGTVSLLGAAVAERPLLVAVDDFQWFDADSRQSLLFAARRLPAGGALLLIGSDETEFEPDWDNGAILALARGAREISGSPVDTAQARHSAGAPPGAEVGTGAPLRRSDPPLVGLTRRELAVALAVGRGATNREAASSLFVTEKTIESHLHHVYRKLRIRSRSELAHLLGAADGPVTSR